MTVNALILAAGHGTRMGKISEELAKPAICVAGEPIVSRLLRQLLQLPEISTVYINCSHKAETVVDSILKVKVPEDKEVCFLWERKPMGSAWSVMKVIERNLRDILVVHGDLLLRYGEFSRLIEISSSHPNLSFLSIHQRERRRARSVVHLNMELVSHVRESFDNQYSRGENLVWSNSGIYLFRASHLIDCMATHLIGKNIQDIFLPKIAASGRMAWYKIAGDRYSVETPEDIKRAENIFKGESQQ